MTFNRRGEKWPFLTGITRNSGVVLNFLSLISVVLAYLVVAESLEHLLLEIDEFIHELFVLVLVTCQWRFSQAGRLLSWTSFVTSIDTLSVYAIECLVVRIFDWFRVLFWIFAAKFLIFICFLSFLLNNLTHILQLLDHNLLESPVWLLFFYRLFAQQHYFRVHKLQFPKQKVRTNQKEHRGNNLPQPVTQVQPGIPLLHSISHWWQPEFP